MWRRRHKGRLAERATARADPVLGSAEFSWSEASATDTVKQTFVDLLDQAQGDGQVAKVLQTVVHGVDVIDNLIYIRG